MPYIVIIIDELAFLMTTHKKEVEASIDSLAAVARAAGMHLIVSTQRPSVDVVTGVIKANLTTRAAFAATSKVDSITMLDETGAETLFGQGDMLFREAGGRITRVHGSFVSDDDVEAIVRRMKGQRGKPYQFGAAGVLPGARPQQLLSCAAEADAVKIETPKDRVRAALRGGVTLTTSELEERAAVTRQQIGRMRDSLFIEEARMSGSRSGWKLRG
jgi:S-DNA-T family DNA segregation ATPase FtsK/SpoIIIE